MQDLWGSPHTSAHVRPRWSACGTHVCHETRVLRYFRNFPETSGRKMPWGDVFVFSITPTKMRRLSWGYQNIHLLRQTDIVAVRGGPRRALVLIAPGLSRFRARPRKSVFLKRIVNFVRVTWSKTRVGAESMSHRDHRDVLGLTPRSDLGR